MDPVRSRGVRINPRPNGRPPVKVASKSTMRKRKQRLRNAEINSSLPHDGYVHVHVAHGARGARTGSDDAAPPEQCWHDTDRSEDIGDAPDVSHMETDRSEGTNNAPDVGHLETDRSVGASLSPRTKNACLLASWQANRGKASDAAMQELLEDVIPQLNPSDLPKWRQVPGLIFAAEGRKEPQLHEFVVCKQCGVTKGGDHCPWCTTRATIANTWETQGCAIMDIADIVRSWFRSPEDASAMLAYLRPPGLDSSMPHSIRATFYYDLLKALSEDHSVELGVVGLLHFDGFAPFAQSPDDYTVDYLQVRPVLDELHGCMQRFARPWVLWDGPNSVKSLEPITHVLKKQVR